MRPVNYVFSMPWRGVIGPEAIRQPRPSPAPVTAQPELKMPLLNLPSTNSTFPASAPIQSGIDAATVRPPRQSREIGAPDVPQIAQLDINKIWQQRKLENPLDAEATR